MSRDLDAAGGPLALLKLGLDPASLNPLADEDEPGYIPTVDVIRIVRQHRSREYILQRAAREGYKQFGETDQDSAFDDCIAVEMACREILNANRWMLSTP